MAPSHVRRREAAFLSTSPSIFRRPGRGVLTDSAAIAAVTQLAAAGVTPAALALSNVTPEQARDAIWCARGINIPAGLIEWLMAAYRRSDDRSTGFGRLGSILDTCACFEADSLGRAGALRRGESRSPRTTLYRLIVQERV